jgi:hypothetical protein
MFSTRRRLGEAEGRIAALEHECAALRLAMDGLDPHAVAVAQEDARNVLRDAAEADVRKLDAHTQKCLGVISEEGARYVAEAKAAGSGVEALRKELARSMRLGT